MTLKPSNAVTRRASKLDLSLLRLLQQVTILDLKTLQHQVVNLAILLMQVETQLCINLFLQMGNSSTTMDCKVLVSLAKFLEINSNEVEVVFQQAHQSIIHTLMTTATVNALGSQQVHTLTNITDSLCKTRKPPRLRSRVREHTKTNQLTQAELIKKKFHRSLTGDIFDPFHDSLHN